MRQSEAGTPARSRTTCHSLFTRQVTRHHALAKGLALSNPHALIQNTSGGLPISYPYSLTICILVGIPRRKCGIERRRSSVLSPRRPCVGGDSYSRCWPIPGLL